MLAMGALFNGQLRFVFLPDNVNTDNKAPVKATETHTLRLTGMCKRQIAKMGRMSIARSEQVLTTLLTYKSAEKLIQRPGKVGSQILLLGVHWKTLTNVIAV